MKYQNSPHSAAAHLITAAIAACFTITGACAQPVAEKKRTETITVSGTGIHRFSEIIIHSKKPTESGEVILSTDIIELFGDMRGEVLYHPVAVFDYQRGKAVITGHQAFSGTIKGSAPVMLFDDEFRFEVNLMTGETYGEVFLNTSLAGRRAKCEIIVEGAGAPPGLDSEISYEGVCKLRKKPRRGDHYKRSTRN